MSWIYLLIAGALEICFAISLKFMNGHKNIPFTILFYLSMLGSLYFLEKASRIIPIGTAYAIWTGIGAFGTALIGILWLKDPANLGRIFFLILLIISIVGLKMTSSE